MINKKLKLMCETLKNSHPHYLGEDFYLSIRHDSKKGFYVVFYMAEAYKRFITSYCLECFLSVGRLLNVNVSIRIENRLPVISVSDGSYC